jgi:hypothetical protein
MPKGTAGWTVRHDEFGVWVRDCHKKRETRGHSHPSLFDVSRLKLMRSGHDDENGLVTD